MDAISSHGQLQQDDSANNGTGLIVKYEVNGSTGLYRLISNIGRLYNRGQGVKPLSVRLPGGVSLFPLQSPYRIL